MQSESHDIRSRLKRLFFGTSLNLGDSSIFHNISLIAFFAWVGLGADGLSSSCYGPEEAFLALGSHQFLAIFVALGSALTILVISISYSQIIELFPSGGGGYIVASKLLSPRLGMVSGCALLIDYVLTIAISVASGADAIFSFLPADLLEWKLAFGMAGVLLLTLLNLRGVKESVLALVPIFMVFVVTHAFSIGYAFVTHLADLPAVSARIGADVQAAQSEMGLMGMILIILRAYTMGAGTYTGIEAVSNGLPILREPRAKTGKRTMLFMASSLGITVVGLMLAYLLYEVAHQPGKTLNAVLFESIAASWPAWLGRPFVLVTLVSEAMLLIVAAQAGFLDGPRVLANMAMDRWFPSRFALLSDRLVTRNGILLMGGASLLLMELTQGKVRVLVVLYSINVFITFVLSQLGMVRHWWQERGKVEHVYKKLLLNGLGLILTSFILVSVVVMKFHEGGWITILVTGALAWLAIRIRRHYDETLQQIRSLDAMAEATRIPPCGERELCMDKPMDHSAKTAVILLNGYNGLGLHTLANIFKLHGDDFKNFVFLQVGVVDAAVVRSSQELTRLKESIRDEMEKYVILMHSKGYHAEAHWAVGTDVVHEILQLTPDIKEEYPRCVFFAGQLVFHTETMLTRWLHNYVVFSLQRQIYRLGIPFMIMPVQMDV
jgi:amino acid transporter